MIRNLGFVFMIDHVFKTYNNNYKNNLLQEQFSA